ncbi:MULTISPECIES: phosphatase PAP2 family protein [unclassified Corallococcus]|uniref:phosphatase PAP2 family protein n=1 Tax=unclassified Corallococcus TaxID=2685029 RepID=UPI001A8E9034|nr:phosphatase PAP2 family protein [Corallococcus sp. NCRR]MBN9686505.1 phosphatase PAP2 family protein [Corallococcus sp. NCSPR001]WAS82067.1 phosphatase PAP2 family protein [Corallococcus sp. NCRR]
MSASNGKEAHTEGPLFGWPERGELKRTGAMTCGFALFFLAVYGGASWVTGFYSGGLRVDLPFEQHIPFMPGWAAVYISMDVLLLLSLFIFRTWRQMLPFALALCAQTVLGALCFLVLPVEVAWPPRAVTGIWASIFQAADTMNLERNYLPSLHVAFACTAALAYRERSGPVASTVFALWALAIAASTLLIHEHHMVDVFAGALLAWGMWRVVAPRVRKETFLEAVRVEALCAREMYRFARRHPRYGLIALALYQQSLGRWRKARRARAGFCFLQMVDDVLDGDRPVEGEPLDAIDALLRTLAAGAPGPATEFHATAVTLGRVLLTELSDPEAREQVLELVRTMRRDRERVRDGHWWDEATLQTQLGNTFRLSVNLMLHVADAQVRAEDAPSLLAALGWCSVMRDLREDLAQGLFNVPADVAAEVRAQGHAPEDFDSLLTAQAGRAWVLGEYQRARALLDRSAKELAQLEGRQGAALLRLFHGSVEAFWARKLPRRMPFLREAPVLEST